MAHDITWRQPAIVPGQFAFASGDAQTDLSFPDAVSPANATPIDEVHDVVALQGCLNRIAHEARGTPWGIAGLRNFNPDQNGQPRPLPKSAWLEFDSMGPRSEEDGGGSVFALKGSFDARCIVWHDWTYQDPSFIPGIPAGQQQLHPLHGQPMRSAIQPGDWIELDAITGQGYVDADGIPRILVAPGKIYYVVDILWETGEIVVLEPNVPQRTQAAWSADGNGVLGGWLWRMVQAPGDTDIGDPVILHEDATGTDGDYVDHVNVSPELNIEHRVCAYDRFVFGALWDKRADGKLGWVSDLTYTAQGGGRREAKTCTCTDVLNRLLSHDGYLNPDPNAPAFVYPEHRRNQACRAGVEGPLVQMCDGGASANDGVPICSQFVPRTQGAANAGSQAHARMVKTLNGLEVVGTQAWVGYPLINYDYVSPPSIAGVLGHWWPTAGGADGLPAKVLGICGGWGAIVDERVDDDGELVGWLGSVMRRCRDVFDAATALARSAVARFITGARALARTGADIATLHLDHRCDVLDGVSQGGYSLAQTSHYSRQVIKNSALYTGSRKIQVDLPAGTREIKLAAPMWPDRYCQQASEDITGYIVVADNASGSLQFDALPSTPYAEHVIGHYAEWFTGNDNKQAVEHDSIKTKAQVHDSVHFDDDDAVPEALRGRGFVISALTKTGTSDLVTCYGITFDDDVIGKQVVFRRRRAMWIPGSTVTIKRRDAGQTEWTTLTSGQYELDPCGRESGGEVEWHIRLSSSVGVDSEVLVEFAQALISWSPQRAAHLTEARALISNATTMRIELQGEEPLQAAYRLLWYYQRGGPLDPTFGWVYGSLGWTVPNWGPLCGPVQQFNADPRSSRGVTWEVGSPNPEEWDEYPLGNAQSKVVYTDVWGFPDNLHFSSADAVKSAYVWVKATATADNPAGTTVSARLVKRHRDKSQVWCANAQLGNDGKCCGGFTQTPGAQSGGLHESLNGHYFAPDTYPVPGTGWWPTYPVGYNYGWVTSGRRGHALGTRTDLHGTNITTMQLTEEYCMGRGLQPYQSPIDTESEGPPYDLQPLVECTLANHLNGSLRCVHQGGGTEEDYFVAAHWQLHGSGDCGEIPIDEAWHKLYVTEAFKAAMELDSDWHTGLAIGVTAAINIALTGPGSFVQVSWEPGPTHPAGDPGGEDASDKIIHWDNIEGVTPSHGQSVYQASADVQVAGPVIVEFEEAFAAPLPSICNLPGVEDLSP